MYSSCTVVSEMSSIVSTIALLLYTCLNASYGAPMNVQVRDLGRVLNDHALFWPSGTQGFQHKFTANSSEYGFWLMNGEFTSPEHVATHIDAPAHFALGKWDVNDLPVDRLVAPGSIIDVRSKARDNPDYQLSVKDIEDWEKEHERTIAATIVLVNFGWAKHYSNRTYYFAGPNGSLGPNGTDTSDLHFPGIHPATAQWIVDNRDTIYGIGLDTPSIDFGPSADYKSHQILYAKNIYGIENLMNLEGLPPTGTQISALPMKIEGGSGAPARVLARWTTGKSNDPSNGVQTKSLSRVILFLIFVWLFLTVSV